MMDSSTLQNKNSIGSFSKGTQKHFAGKNRKYDHISGRYMCGGIQQRNTKAKNQMTFIKLKKAELSINPDKCEFNCEIIFSALRYLKKVFHQTRIY